MVETRCLILGFGSGFGSGSGSGSGELIEGSGGNGKKGDLCDIDPSKLLLEHVSKLFHGNFSCEASNGAGWSDRSEETPLEVHCKHTIKIYRSVNYKNHLISIQICR